MSVAATPPLEAKKLLFSCTKGMATPLSLLSIYARIAYCYTKSKCPAFVQLRGEDVQWGRTQQETTTDHEPQDF